MLTLQLHRTNPSGLAVKGTLTLPFDQLPLTYDEQPIIVPTLENRDFLIPEGTYPLDLTWSPRFKKRLPLVNNVPDREGIRIHLGTRPEHSQGCILVNPYGLNCIQALFNRLDKYFEDETLYIRITSEKK